MWQALKTLFQALVSFLQTLAQKRVKIDDEIADGK